MSDTQAPQLLGVTLDTTTLDPSTPGGAFLSGAITFSDDLSGLSNIYITYTEVNSGQEIQLSFNLSEFGGNALTGNALNGTITSSRQLDRFAASGDYIISSIQVDDQAGNGEFYSRFEDNWDTQLDALNIAEAARSFTVANSSADTQAPQLIDVTLDTTTLDPSAPGGAFLSGAITFSDDLSGLSNIFITYTEVNSGQEIQLSFKLSEFGGDALTGNARNGTITSSSQLDRFAASGDYIISSIQVDDQAGNGEFYSRFEDNWDTQLDALNIAEAARSFTVANSSADTQAPQLIDVTLDTTTLDPSAPGGAFLSGAITFSDDLSGLSNIFITYTEVNSGQEIQLSFKLSEFGGDALTGNARNGTITSSSQLDRFAASGDYIISSIQVDDQAGNGEFYSRFEDNWDTQLDALNIAEAARSFTVANSSAEPQTGEDSSAPTITGLNLSATTIDPSQPGGAFLTADVSFTDDASGIDFLFLSFESVDSNQEITFSLLPSDSLEGNLLEGSIGTSEFIDPFAANGEYVLRQIEGSDKAGNQFVFRDNSELPVDNSDWEQFLSDSNIQQTSFEINNSQSDITAPTITGLNLSATTIDPSQPGGAFLTADVSFTDDASGIDFLFLSFESVDSNQEITFSLLPSDSLEGNLLEGSIGTSEFIDPFAANGEYVLRQIEGSDKAGNQFVFRDNSELPGDNSDWEQFLSDSNIQQTSFEINNSQSDITAPTITGLNLSATTIDPSQPGGAFLTADVSFTDDASGIDFLFLSFESVDSNQEITFSLLPSDSLEGNLLEGSIGTSEFIDPFAANGEYVLRQIEGSDKAGNQFVFRDNSELPVDNSDWEQFLSDSNIQQTSFEIKRSDSDNGAVDADNNGLVDNTPVYTLFNDGDPLTITKERSDGSTRTFSATGIPNWDATQAVNTEDNSGNFYVLLEGADGSTREDQFKVWTTDISGSIASSTGWRSAEQLVQAGWEERFNIDFDGDELIGIPTADEDQNGLVDNTSVYTLFNDGDPLTISKQRANGSTRNFSATGIPNWDVTQAVNAEDNSGNFYLLLEGADGTTREDQYKVWTTDKTASFLSGTGWRSAEQLSDAWGEFFSILNSTDSTTTSISV
ncbi:hypothetical protein [Synechococcus sp. CC9311]|uniref:hypothetical protein n=1 Tax=Synechococcus sp. (strain CC9311) TaxID=64471 RepID=UPI00059E5D76|nr:hypothetical protein [Synechococcus sp. CC9311]